MDGEIALRGESVGSDQLVPERSRRRSGTLSLHFQPVLSGTLISYPCSVKTTPQPVTMKKRRDSMLKPTQIVLEKITHDHVNTVH